MLNKTLEISYARAKDILYKTLLYIIHYYILKLFINVLYYFENSFIIFHIEQYMKYHITIYINAMITAVIIIIFIGDNEVLDECLRYILDGFIICILLFTLN